MKKITTLAGASLLAGALLTNQVVLAEEIGTSPQENKQETAKETVTREVVDQAKTDLDKATNDVNNKTAEVANAQSNVNTAQSNMDKAQQLVNEATDENKEKVANQIADEQANLSSQEAELETLNAAKVDKEKEITNQTKAVESAQADVDAAQTDVNVAEKDVADKQAALDGTDAEQVAKELDTAKTNHESVSNELEQAESDLEQSKKEDIANKQLVDALTAQKSAADTEQATAKSDVDKAQSDVSTKQSDVQTKQTAFDKAKNDFDSINTIVVSDKYVKLLKEYANHRLNTRDKQKMDETVQKLFELNSDLLRINRYKPNKNDDDSIKYRVNELPEDVRLELSFFAADLINQVRDQMGSAHLKVTQSGMDFAKAISKRVYADKFNSFDDGHYRQAIVEFAEEYGLPKGQFYENLTVIRHPEHKLDWTLSELKKRVYDSITSFLFNGREYNHAYSIAGLETEGARYDTESFGVDFSITGLSDVSTHYLKVSERQLERAARNNPLKQFNNTEIANPITKQSIVDNYNKAQSDLTRAQSALETAKQAVQQAQSAYDMASAKVDEIARQLNSAQSKVSMTPDLQIKVDQLLANEKVAKDALDKAQENFDNLSADVKTKQATLDAAKQNLATDQQTLATRQDVLTAETVKLNDLVKELETIDSSIGDKRLEIAKTNESIKELTDYLAKLNSADEVYTDAVGELNVAKDEIAKLQDELVDLEAVKEIAETRYNTSKAEYDLLVQIEENIEPKEVQINEKEAVQVNNFTPVNDSLPHVTYNKVLPKTGDELSMLGVVGVLLTSFSAIVLRKEGVDE